MSTTTAASAAPSPSLARPFLGSVVLVLVLLLAAAGLKSYRDLEAARAHEAALQTRIRATEESIDELRRRIELLGKDPVTLERVAREDLGLVKPGDVVIVLPPEDEKTVSPAPPAPPASTP